MGLRLVTRDLCWLSYFPYCGDFLEKKMLNNDINGFSFLVVGSRLDVVSFPGLVSLQFFNFPPLTQVIIEIKTTHL